MEAPRDFDMSLRPLLPARCCQRIRLAIRDALKQRPRNAAAAGRGRMIWLILVTALSADSV